MARWFYAREIIEDLEAQEAADQFRVQFDRFEDAFEALKWLLARKCDEIEALRRSVDGVEYHLYRQASDPIAGTPEIVVLYTYDDDQVTIIGLNADEPEEEID